MDDRQQSCNFDAATLRVIRSVAKRLAGRYGFSRDEYPDLTHDLVLSYWARRTAFNSERGNHVAFVRTVALSSASATIGRQKAACRDYRLRLPAETVRHPRLCSVRNTRENRTVAALDVRMVVSGLSSELQRICALLTAERTPDEIAAQLGISRATLYRRMSDIRAAFLAAGIGATRC